MEIRANLVGRVLAGISRTMRATKPFVRSETDTRFESLNGSGAPLALTYDARLAALVFVSSAKYGWSKRELAAWLVNDYAGATLRTETSEAVFDRCVTPITSSSPVTESAVTRLVAAARRHVIELLATIGAPAKLPGFVRDAVDRGIVVALSDTGSCGYAAVNRPRMALVDRVASLFVADYLSHPRDYASLVVCATCDEVSFAWDEMHEEDCMMKSPRSGIIVKRRHATFVGIGDERERGTGS